MLLEERDRGRSVLVIQIQPADLMRRDVDNRLADVFLGEVP